jgi:hypothetical protein
MKTLEKELIYQGRTLKQFKREGRIAVYEISARNVPYGYEVIIVQNRPAETLPSGKSYPDREVYPGAEEWGTHGWSYQTSDLEGAQNRYNSLR